MSQQGMLECCEKALKVASDKKSIICGDCNTEWEKREDQWRKKGGQSTYRINDFVEEKGIGGEIDPGVMDYLRGLEERKRS